jgi:hypothetical protein
MALLVTQNLACNNLSVASLMTVSHMMSQTLPAECGLAAHPELCVSSLTAPLVESLACRKE